MIRIAIQGEAGSFHDIAAHEYFHGEEIQLICCQTFEQVFSAVSDDPTVVALVAIENTIAGSLLHNYELLRESGTTVVGEHKLHITHSISCLPDDTWETLSEVHSHPVALMQTRHYLAHHPELRIVEADDTAGAARRISEGNLHGHAAICHAAAARQYGLKVLEDGIEDNKHNFTRFLVCAASGQADRLRPLTTTDKASLVFALPHEEGSLSPVLSVLSFYKMNLTKIQSLPIIGHEWEYLFYVDVTYADPTRFHQAVNAILPLTSGLKILGEYKKAPSGN
ncbi:MAG: prephenate dehydratase [Prevotella sp.]|nr:prephenate dehydratase [Prevotella sp.]